MSDLIDKAEALAPCPFCGGEATFSEGKTGDGKPWHYVECSDCEAMGPGVSYADHNIAVKSALADAWNRRAIPARGVGVKPWPQEEISPGVYVDVDPESLAALSPAPDAREAALREAAEVAKSWYRQWAMYSGGNEPTRDDRAGGITYGRLQGAETIAAGILALIGEASHD